MRKPRASGKIEEEKDGISIQHQERLSIHGEEANQKSDGNEKEPVPPRHTDAASSASGPLYHVPRAAAHYYLRRHGRSLGPQEVRYSTMRLLPPSPSARSAGCVCSSARGPRRRPYYTACASARRSPHPHLDPALDRVEVGHLEKKRALEHSPITVSPCAHMAANNWAPGIKASNHPPLARERERDGGEMDGKGLAMTQRHEGVAGRLSSQRLKERRRKERTPVVLPTVDVRDLSRENVRDVCGAGGEVQGKGSNGAPGNRLETKFESARATRIRTRQFGERGMYTALRFTSCMHCLRHLRVRFKSGEGYTQASSVDFNQRKPSTSAQGSRQRAQCLSFQDDGEPAIAEWMCPVRTESCLSDQNASFPFFPAGSDGSESSMHQNKYRAAFVAVRENESDAR
ncbi:hypothetical protein B0H19DRAFT_1074683 [Mycena capillaripes]|nr:hypothetical protein B0H19DRAFT_1074683 [Mycena capillaripes]